VPQATTNPAGSLEKVKRKASQPTVSFQPTFFRILAVTVSVGQAGNQVRRGDVL